MNFGDIIVSKNTLFCICEINCNHLIIQNYHEKLDRDNEEKYLYYCKWNVRSYLSIKHSFAKLFVLKKYFFVMKSGHKLFSLRVRFAIYILFPCILIQVKLLTLHYTMSYNVHSTCSFSRSIRFPDKRIC